MDVTDLGDEDRRQDRSDAGQLLDGVIAGVVAEQVGDRVGEFVDLAGKASTSTTSDSMRCP